MLSIKKYTAKNIILWNNFINTSNNGTIFQSQSFLKYHLKRKFIDNSLIFKKKNKIIAVLPAVKHQSKNQLTLYSHPGASYGGIIIPNEISFKTINEIIQSLEFYCIQNGFKSIILINTPIIYFNKPNESINYLLYWNQYFIKELYISHAVDLSSYNHIGDFLSKRKQRYIKNSTQLSKFKIKPSDNFYQFYQILSKSKKTYKTKPTHSLKELISLKKIFPKQCELLITSMDKKVVGGALLFFANKKVSLVFYNVVDESFRNSQLSSYQLFKCMEFSKKRGVSFVDFGVSHTPEQNNPLAPKLSLIKFKEQFGARGVIRTIYKKVF